MKVVALLVFSFLSAANDSDFESKVRPASAKRDVSVSVRHYHRAQCVTTGNYCSSPSDRCCNPNEACILVYANNIYQCR